MEGAGLYTACQDRKVDWILVKGICDWADGHKEQDRETRQQIAARNAARFVSHAISFTPFHPPEVRPLPSRRPDPSRAASGYSNLPTQPHFFGRKQELATVLDAIAPESRTWGALIDGPGGIGKTALAVRVGHLAPAGDFERKIFLSAKVRELTPGGEQPLEDYMLPNYLALLNELARELGEPEIARLDPAERAKAVSRALAGKRALILIDNVETFAEPERNRLYQFLSRLPPSCKAIVTSRRRSDLDARVLRLDRLSCEDAQALLAELANNNHLLAAATAAERLNLYEETGGNPLLMTWVVKQLGRPRSHCRTLAEASEFLREAPPGNDPLEYVFGDLLDTFTESETKVLAALSHFTEPAAVPWVADLTRLTERQARTALEDLQDRALLFSDTEARTFVLSALLGHFLRRKCPEIMVETGARLADRVYAPAIETGYKDPTRFSQIECEWPVVEAALPLFIQGENTRLQTLCAALSKFLNFSGRWDERLRLSQKAEENALAGDDFHNAGWRAYDQGWVYQLRGQAVGVFHCADRADNHWQKAETGTREKADLLRLRGLGHRLQKDYRAAIETLKEALKWWRELSSESPDVAMVLNDLADAERRIGDHANAKRHICDALRIAENLGNREGVAMFTGSLAGIARDMKEWVEAERLARLALTLAEDVGRQQLIAGNCRRLASVLARQDRKLEALPYAERSVEIYTRLRSAGLRRAQAVLKECDG